MTDELNEQGRRIYEATQQLIDRTKAAGELRDDIEVGDLSLPGPAPDWNEISARYQPR